MADALSRKANHEEATLCLISFPSVDWIKELKNTYANDLLMQELLTNSASNTLHPPTISLKMASYFTERDCIPQNETFKAKLLEPVHGSPWEDMQGMARLCIEQYMNFFGQALRQIFRSS